MASMTRRPLLTAALVWAALNVVHALDHLRQGRELAFEVRSVGLAGFASTAVLLFLVLRRHRLAAPFAAVFGVSIVVGFTLVHFVPHWSVFSDPYADLAEIDTLAWILAIVPALAGAWLAVTAARELRAPGPSGTT